MRDNALHKLIAAEPEKIHVNQIYKAMDVFYKYSEKIFQKIYKQNSNDNKLLLYDITSIYFEGLGPEDLAKFRPPMIKEIRQSPIYKPVEG